MPSDGPSDGPSVGPSDGPSVGGAARTYAAVRAERSAALDQWLARLLGDERDVALVAVGGHGRRELAPGSDLDLVLLHRGHPNLERVAGTLWYGIWDAGLRLDHAVRTVGEARQVAAENLRTALSSLDARHVAGDPELTAELRGHLLADWRAAAARRLPELREAVVERAGRHGELAFLLEPDLKEARGGLRDVHAIHAVAAAWVADMPKGRVREAYGLLLDTRHALHEVTGRPGNRLVAQERAAVARALGVTDGDRLFQSLAEAARRVSYAADLTWRHLERGLSTPGGSRRPSRRPLADGVVEQDGEVVLARAADPGRDPCITLRAASAAARAGLPLAPSTLGRLATRAAAMPVPWPRAARDSLVALLGAGRAAIPVWEALDQAGLVTALLPEWAGVRNRPQSSPVHRFTVDRHLVEAAVAAGPLTHEVARPDLLLLGALLHDIGKGGQHDHCRAGERIARSVARRIGLPAADTDTLGTLVREHLLLPRTATRRDLDDPAAVRQVADRVGTRDVLNLLFLLAVADGQATGPAAWNEWKAALVADLVRRVDAVLAGDPPPPPPELTPEQRELAEAGGPAVRVDGPRVSVCAPESDGLLWRAAGVLALHRLDVRAATVVSHGSARVVVFTTAPAYGSPPEAGLIEDDLRRVSSGGMDVAGRLERRRAHAPRSRAVPGSPRVSFLDDVSRSATVVEVRAHDRPGLLYEVGRALHDCDVHVRAARVETLGAEAVDAFYVVDGSGQPLYDAPQRSRVRDAVVEAAGLQAGEGSRDTPSGSTGDPPLYGKPRLAESR